MFSTVLIYVAGGGRFGSKALESLTSLGKVILVDINSDCIACKKVDCVANDLQDLIDVVESSRCRSTLLVSDASHILAKLMIKGFTPDIVIPTIPIHLAGEVTRLFLLYKGIDVKPYSGIVTVLERLRSFNVETRVDEEKGVVIASYMPFNTRCLERCSEPPICPVTGKLKPYPLYQLMEDLLKEVSDRVKVLISKLLAESIGGFNGLELYNFLKSLTNEIKEGLIIAIATACRCHGVANTFRVVRITS